MNIDRNQIARQDSTLLALIKQLLEGNADCNIVERYINLLTLRSSKNRAEEMISASRLYEINSAHY